MINFIFQEGYNHRLQVIHSLVSPHETTHQAHSTPNGFFGQRC